MQTVSGWEVVIEDTTFRLAVPGGWLYLHVGPYGAQRLMVFVPRKE